MVKYFPPAMEPEGLLQYSQYPARDLYPEPAEFSPHSNILFP
jgi:hypothetical protein